MITLLLSQLDFLILNILKYFRTQFRARIDSLLFLCAKKGSEPWQISAKKYKNSETLKRAKR